MTLPSSALMRSQADLSCWTACRSDGLAESAATGSARVFDSAAVVFIQLFHYWPPPHVGGYNSSPFMGLPAPLPIGVTRSSISHNCAPNGDTFPPLITCGVFGGAR